MSEGSGLFDKRTKEGELPDPFWTIVNRKGKQKYSTHAKDCSIHNPVIKGKSSSLHPATLRAILFLNDIFDYGSLGAVGTQRDDDGNINYFCIEYETETGRCGVIYNYHNGTFKGLCLKDKSIFPIQTENSLGEPFIAILAYASLLPLSPLYDVEFEDNYNNIQDLLHSDEREEELLRSALICCDNLYRRIECGKSVEQGGLPVEASHFRKPIEIIPEFQFKSGICSPNDAIFGEFEIFIGTETLVEEPIRQLKEIYHKDWNINKCSRAKIPKLSEDHKVSVGAQEILRMVTKTSARNFMITGGSGIGKTTDSLMIAQVLGVPYFKLTCGPGTDETELLATPMPNMQNVKPEVGLFPSLQDFMMDPSTALAMITGTYQENINQEKAFQEIISMTYQKGYEMAKNEKDFTMVESAIIQACREPSVLEIQEPSMIENAGTLTKLNGLLDDSGCTDLLNGETIVRNPDTIIILTTNLDYIGCRMFNESILSRMNLVQHRGELSKEQMVNRVMERTGCKEYKLLSEMANIITKIQNHLKIQEIHGGVCGYRELENWVLKYLTDGNVLWAVKDTVVSKAAPLPEDRTEIMESYILPYLNAS